ncbi:iron dependent repressor : Iron dependent repressor OS=Halosarcina pallida JCM 14848 GN=C474_16834 PE=4 SV=1: Fe_dep_repress: Fe_dep_repr_C: FeoA [Gemmata massiliana]|uniref:Transcriptional regulator MntR n=1 Tax=Gemmata massiliana TaxID=1210884 RepID=A0A6P2D5T8_9BACT|nr:metal-dependent transcriptional regulator [Gemmata massiliana]VTR95836.1 iron dependent repressor : Iron dependent repressor OS=Halosarcina pallida JCM 14848 GN=C474_16834 PE=4 SV=1: Fe_dep_repress: Fe_dep_repr_C: FeoA [Gemmata massiliana]
MPDQPTQAVQDYLKAIHRLGGADEGVASGKIASALGVKAPSVTGMLKRLADAGWIEYTSGTGAKLSPAGLSEALRVIRRHRLVELFLTQVLKLDWSEVDAEAEALEHAISPRLEQALADYLGEPHEDPHGHPIPSRTGELKARNLKRLSEFRAGDVVVVREAQDDNPDRLRHWRTQGLTPGARVHVLAYQELDDLFEVEVDGTLIRLGSEGLTGLRGELVTANSAQ